MNNNLSEINIILVTITTIICIITLPNSCSFLICCGSFIYLNYIFYFDAKYHVDKNNARWIYPAIIFIVSFVIGYLLIYDKIIISKILFFISIIMFTRFIINFIFTIVIDITDNRIKSVLFDINNVTQMEINNLKMKLKTSIISTDELERNINIISNDYEQKLDELVKQLNIQNKDLDIVKKTKENLSNQLDTYKKEIEQKNEDIIKMREQQDHYIKLLQEKNESNNYPLENVEIRNKFNEALSIAESEIDIFCPWITEKVVDSFMQDKFRILLEKGISIKIRYGIGQSHNDIRNKKTERFANDLCKMFSKYKNFKMYRDNSHVKLFICDNKFYVISSFNILSFKGDYSGEDNRKELGEYSTNKAILNLYRKRYFSF
ncbi:hypothetical protein [Megamonas funiformis]|uniref:hypothetical protein n=1 Tax=Megamonas funiformis TaxID=437897 RepID=UPI003561B631